ncbi:alpha/beta hydrolase [Nocardioides daejeonensis]|uniref:alpha/beta hydrolase n=1 Tax=Nocardioides daejeonensis TaxID=1046556 RepID=UPI000D74C858|nr:alpha/beta fold hydrolase [Nocardioides daejeonensis]
MSEIRPLFTDVLLPEDPSGLVLLLHGGAQQGARPVDARSLSWRRGRALARRLHPRLAAEGIGTVLLRYRVKGWNAATGVPPAPVEDARWALAQLEQEFGLPVAILGHSMGARTGVAVADHPCVRGVVALAPWLPADEPVGRLHGKVLRAAHGRHDRITSARATRAFVERASHIADARYTDMGPVGHYLLRDIGRWHDVAIAGIRETLVRTT